MAADHEFGLAFTLFHNGTEPEGHQLAKTALIHVVAKRGLKQLRGYELRGVLGPLLTKTAPALF